jgi:tetratricopeptide (TPR) repeat protein
MEQGDLARAIADYDEAIRLDPHDPAVFYNRALARSEQDDLEGAIADVEQGAFLAPEDEDFSKLLEELLEEMDPDDPAIVHHLGNLGLAQEALDQLAEARATFERALAIAERAGQRVDPEMVSVLSMNVGRALEKLGRPAEAEVAYAHGLAIAARPLGEDHEVTAALREALATLQADT